MENPKKINRDSGDKQKGFRLQKLRATEFILQALETSDTSLIYSATDTDEDVQGVISDESGTKRTFEQNKAYDPESGFSFQNENVLKSLANFICCFSEKNFSNTISFIFYSTNRIAKERPTERTKELKIELPTDPIIKLLSENNYNSHGLLEVTSKLLIDYSREKNQIPEQILSQVESWNLTEWKSFFSKITWMFEQDSIEELEKRLLKKIAEFPLYRSINITNRESSILASIMDLYDKRQTNENKTERFVYCGDVKNCFLEASTGARKIDDPSWQEWEKIPKTDKRGLAKKLQAVCSNITEHNIGRYSRKASCGLNLLSQNQGEKSILSVRYRIYSKCVDLLHNYIQINQGKIIEVSELDLLIEELSSDASREINELAKDFHYSVTAQQIVQDILLELIDSCYLSFDKQGI